MANIRVTFDEIKKNNQVEIVKITLYPPQDRFSQLAGILTNEVNIYTTKDNRSHNVFYHKDMYSAIIWYNPDITNTIRKEIP